MSKLTLHDGVCTDRTTGYPVSPHKVSKGAGASICRAWGMGINGNGSTEDSVPLTDLEAPSIMIRSPWSKIQMSRLQGAFGLLL